jgi:hypothetical protein
MIVFLEWGWWIRLKEGRGVNEGEEENDNGKSESEQKED